MIIIISGNSCTGKTLMAQKLLEKYKIPYLSVDLLKMGLYRGISDCGFTPLDSNEVIGDKLWPIIKGIIMTSIENKQSLIVEGCYLFPLYLKEIETIYPGEIISVFLGFTNKYINEKFTYIINNRNAIETRGYQEERIINDFINEHNEFRIICQEAKVKYFEIDQDYEEDIKMIYDYIEDKIRMLAEIADR